MALWAIREWKTAGLQACIVLMALCYRLKNTLSTLAQTTTLQRQLGLKRCFHFPLPHRKSATSRRFMGLDILLLHHIAHGINLLGLVMYI